MTTDTLMSTSGGATEAIDAILGQEDAFRAGPAWHGITAGELIWHAVRRHRETNPRYDRYCTRRNLPDDPDPDTPLSRVPLLPTVLFKRGPAMVFSSAGRPPVIDTTSSGTLGTVSTVPRCDATLMRFFGSVAVGSREVLGSETFDQAVFHIGPSIRDNPTLWIAYVMAGMSVILPTTSYMDGERMRRDALLADLALADPDRGVMLVGPPPLILDLARPAGKKRKLRLGGAAQVVTIGGWKRRGGEAVDRATFRRVVVDSFGLADESQVRDTYNMVELNTVLFECAAGALHVPPWLAASARDPQTLAPLPTGAGGLLSFLDPTAVSYPCFLLSDDFGVVHAEVDCPCGIRGDTLEVHRRVSRVESRGCALKLDIEPAGGQHA